ncbi:MAG TPA: hypothetical protein VLI45_08170 [Acidobacteriaceae bacterium]|nr:hypothetical protein [Acidobacteriaceae bacterium]
MYLGLILSIEQLYLAAGQDVTIMRSEQLTGNGVQFRERDADVLASSLLAWA